MAAFALFVCGPIVWAAASKADHAKDVSLTPDESLMVRAINAERADRDLEPLRVDSLLTRVARKHSADMAARDYFSHLAEKPAPRTPLDRYAAALGRPAGRETVIGENIGRSDQPVMSMVHRAMMASAAHRANILDREFSRVGVGVHQFADGRTWITEVFQGRATRRTDERTTPRP